MKLYNSFLIKLINNQRSSNIQEGKEFNLEDIKENHIWDDFCTISYEDYIANQNDETFLKDISVLNINKVQIGLVIGDVSKLSSEKAEQLKGNLRIYIFNQQEEKMSNNSFFYLDEYVEARKKLDSLMSQIDISEPNKLKIAKQMFVLLRKQYTHGFPSSEDVLTGIRYSQNMYGCFCKNKGICRGGANTYRAMCSLANIPCKVINIFLYPEEANSRHSLNQICINGEWGIVDVEQKKDTPEDTSLFFCSQDTYQSFWKDRGRYYEIFSNTIPMSPTNISVSREYINSLDMKTEVNQGNPANKQTEGKENFRTLALTEIASGITDNSFKKIYPLYKTKEKEGFKENDSI